MSYLQQINDFFSTGPSTFNESLEVSDNGALTYHYEISGEVFKIEGDYNFNGLHISPLLVSEFSDDSSGMHQRSIEPLMENGRKYVVERVL